MEINMVQQQLNENKFLKLLSLAKSSERFERKFRFDLFHKNFVMFDFINSGFIKAYDKRTIQSLYFDTNQNDFYVSNLNGDRDRIKVRLRQYNNLKKFSLELKIKSNSLGYKYIIKNICENSIDFDYINNIVFQLTGYSVEPKIWVSYAREYFIHPLYKFSACIDNNLEFSPVSKKITQYRHEKSSYNVAEVKYPVNMDNIFKNFSNKNLMNILRYNKFSKYIESKNENMY